VADLVLLHAHCHDVAHSKRCQHLHCTKRSAGKCDLLTKEPCEGKLSRTARRGGVAGQQVTVAPTITGRYLKTHKLALASLAG